MAQASRSHSANLSDDPLENATDWVRMNSRPVGMVLTGIAVVALLIVGYRWMDNSKRTEASTALQRAVAPLQSGKPQDAEAALDGVAKKFGGTSAGQQASLIAAQLRYDRGEYDAGIKSLESARGSASEEFAASFEQLIAMGYESKGQNDRAAEHYGKAASAARFEHDKGEYQLAQARALMRAGKLADAKALWEALAALPDSPFATEASIRLGEIAGASAK